MNIPAIGYGVCSAFYLILSLVLLTGQRGQRQKIMLFLASAISAVWAGSMAYSAIGGRSFLVPHLLELLRDFAWIGFVLSALSVVYGNQSKATVRYNKEIGACILAASMLAALTIHRYMTGTVFSPVGNLDILTGSQLLVAILGLVLVEQLFRNTRKENRQAIKYICMGLGVLFAFDFYMYADALVFQQLDSTPWQARGYVNALIVPVMGIAVARNPRWSKDIFVSRKIVFHTASLLSAGLYLLAIGAGGYYVRFYGGEWGAVAQLTFFFAAAVVMLIVLFSGQIRATLRVLISKHFFHYKYDYRDEWLRVTQALSTGQSLSQVQQHSIQAVAAVINAPAGMLWMRKEYGAFELEARWNMDDQAPPAESLSSSLVRFMEGKEWVINLDEYDRDPGLYKGLEIPKWLQDLEQAWLVTPLMLRDRLIAFVVLAGSPARHHFNWEDSDLLKTAGRQAATHLAQIEADDALADAKQFEIRNRLTAYVMHDLKNLIAQLSLVVSNAERHRDNPDFMEDAINTVGNSVAKMNRLLQHLRSGDVQEKPLEYLDLCSVLTEVVEAMSGGLPVPVLDCQARGIGIRTDRDKFTAIISHLIQNAQDATMDKGRIIVRLFKTIDQAAIEVQDDGVGMDEAFVSERLFRPFDTTKGTVGTGIGAHQVREFVREAGGDMGVISRVGEGTTFRVRLPLSDGPNAVQSDIV